AQVVTRAKRRLRLENLTSTGSFDEPLRSAIMATRRLSAPPSIVDLQIRMSAGDQRDSAPSRTNLDRR
ncbi:hypothetical protein, partial [Caballeronia sp. 15711]|uniref:hypothetical protein n=1 Tax=Caballeronia sp. 15711 TaxID=3391029 RepID=UPI0039E2D04E